MDKVAGLFLIGWWLVIIGLILLLLRNFSMSLIALSFGGFFMLFSFVIVLNELGSDDEIFVGADGYGKD